MRVVIFHGTDCKPDMFWYSWLENELESIGFDVELLHYPNINKEPVSHTIKQVIKNHIFDSETILVGHSAGVPLILSILERIKQPVKGVALVAGFSSSLEFGVSEPILQDVYKWETIKQHAGDTYIFNSKNDPWGCDDRQGQNLFDKLGGTLIIRNDGHFGSSKDPNYKEFPLLKNIIEGIAK